MKTFVYILTDQEKTVVDHYCQRAIDTMKPLSMNQKACALQILVEGFQDISGIKLFDKLPQPFDEWSGCFLCGRDVACEEFTGNLGSKIYVCRDCSSKGREDKDERTNKDVLQKSG